METEQLINDFIQHCGEMGSQWGFNRTVGQMFGLLLLSEVPLTAQEIADRLSISRGNVSMALKELQSWQVIKVQRYPDDRKDYFTTLDDIWDIAHAVFEERRRREVVPTLNILEKSVDELKESGKAPYARARMEEALNLLSGIDHWAGQLQTLSQEQLQSLMKLGRGINKVLNLTKKKSKDE